MKTGKLLSILSLAGLVVFPVGADELTPYQILQEADKARGNLGGIVWDVGIDSIENGRNTAMTFNVQARAFDIIAQTIAPPKNKGNKILMLKGNMWFYKPDLSKPTPISQRQKLSGNAAYGDIAATNYAEDYEPTALPDEVLNDEDCYVFSLAAKSKKTTYDKITYWVSRKRLVGVKADYDTVSGKKFKSSTMEYNCEVDGEDGKKQAFISKMVIADAITAGNQTTMTFANPVFKEIPSSVFDLNLLVK